jgi:hypothetical protein
MGYQWQNGRFISDEEKAEEDANMVVLLIVLGGAIAAAYFGYQCGGKWLALIAFPVGGYVGYALRGVIALVLLVAIVGAVLIAAGWVFLGI